jgi:hypothetical protein
VRLSHDEVHRRALAVGIGASAVVHVFLILLYGSFMTEWGAPETVLALDSRASAFSDMRVIQVVEIEPPVLAPELPDELPVPTADIQPDLVDAGLADADPFELDERPRGRSAASQLRVVSSDTRLWRQAMPEAFELTEGKRLELEIAGKLEEWADSVAGAIEAELALTDWTTTDDQGRKWGVSPGQLHLGDLTLPLPFYFGGNAWQRDQANRRAWEDQDIARGVDAQALRSSWRERADAIRRRREGDRDEDRAQDAEPPEAPAPRTLPERSERSERDAPPDTTGTSRR